MSKGLKLALAVLAGFFCLSLLHVRLNIGFERFSPARRGAAAEGKMRVGFLPVT